MSSSQSSRLLDLYPREPELPNHNAYFLSASRAYGEATFICQTNNILNAFNASSNDTTAIWSYRYNVQQQGTVERGLGVPHVAEIPAVMGPDMLPYSPDPSYTTYNAAAVPLLMNYWLSFARTLNPNTHKLEQSPDWEQWGRNQSRIVLQSEGSAMENVADGEKERCEFWRDIGSDINQ
jgi:acetylcholinesterase